MSAELRCTASLVTTLLVLLALGGPARGQSFFNSSPGPLTRAHAHIDGPNNCNRCHVTGKRELSSQKCLDCHKAVAERIRLERGVHAAPKARNRPCELCHKDHKGLDYDIFAWPTFGGKERFNHDVTGFRLTGRHSVVECDKCHTQKTPTGRPTYLLAPVPCQGCHKSPHGELHVPLDSCDRCHDAKSWRPVEPLNFDHQKDTRFPLETKHIGVPCAACHPKSLFRLTGWSSDCTPCHRNVHGESLFGQKRCVGCHSARVDWTVVDFDHNRKTRFSLTGPHKKPCVSCHLPADRRAPARKCDACHKDAHLGRFAKVGECSACHLNDSWGPELRFDHDRQTRFVLTGRHGLVECRACHRGAAPSEYENFEKLVHVISGKGRKVQVQVECMGCHRHREVHKGQFTNDQCLSCHKNPGVVEQTNTPESVRKRMLIGHGPGKPFQLVDGHKIADCKKCHRNDQYKGTPTNCGPECHADRLHKGSLGKQCLNCHEGARWTATRFDHQQTDYPLIGKHKEASCEGCHPQRQYKPRPRTCGDAECHLKDDAHAGSLGRKCAGCHSPTGRLSFDHNDPKVPDRWRLEGKHINVRCVGCHPTQKYRPAPVRCEGCHAEPVVHKGELGTRCTDCHEVNGWEKIHTGHNIFPVKFGGAHDRVRCVECHPQGRILQGMAQLCVTCHQRDDIHHNTLGPRCNECHTQQTFAAARFNHDRVGCTLRGVHRVLPCVDCHKGGNYAGLSAQCASCHRDDAARAAVQGIFTAFHLTATGCALCHNPTSFRPGGVGVGGAGPESVCR
ncbi:MAG: cytochrome c3 family protein [Myxococcales bacterium]|nr:hypothetical protein [Myxococcota bacterium]MDW8283574.1 cytochrome c3 family protein [Myxococcales bacterium]